MRAGFLSAGDHVVVNPLGDLQGRIGNVGPTGALTELLRISGAEADRAVRVVPEDLPFEVAALNEPMAAASHGVKRTAPKPGDQVVVFGAGPIGLGAVIGYKARGAGHIVAADILPERLEEALPSARTPSSTRPRRTLRPACWSCTVPVPTPPAGRASAPTSISMPPESARWSKPRWRMPSIWPPSASWLSTRSLSR